MEEGRVVMTIRERDLVLVTVQNEDAEEQQDQETPLTIENKAVEDRHGNRTLWTGDGVAGDNQHETHQTSVIDDNEAAEHHHQDRVSLDEVRKPAKISTAEHRHEDTSRQDEIHIAVNDIAANHAQPNERQQDYMSDSADRVESGAAEEKTNSTPWTIEGVASELLSLYRFLIRAYLPEHKLRVPPQEGWPQITQERFTALKKDSIVIKLLKHLPYIRRDYPDETMIWTDCTCNDYAGLFLQDDICSGSTFWAEGPLVSPENDSYVEPLGSHQIVLGHHKSRDGWCFIFDTRNGTVMNCSPMYGEEEEYDSLAAFVEHVKQRFIQMEVVAISEMELRYEEQHPEEDMERYKGLLIKHGWPGPNFTKNAYLQEASAGDYDDVEYYKEPELPYSVRHVEAQLLSLYRFLVRMYLPEDMLRVPSHNGWDNVDHSLYIHLHKTSRVGMLLRHLPYIRQDLQDERPAMMFVDSVCVDYSGQLMSRDVASSNQWCSPGLLLSQAEHLLVIATDNTKSTSSIVFDTLTGKVERSNADQSLQIFETIDDLVQCIKQEFTDLQICPVDNLNVEQDSVPAELDKYRSIFRKHGWPGEHYSKEDCLAELQAVRKEPSRRLCC